MKPFFVRLLFLGFVFLSLFFSSCKRKNAEPEAITREEAIAAIRAFDQGWNNKNAAAVDSILAPAYVYFTQSGGMFSRDSVVATASSPQYSLKDVSRDQYDVEIFANTAVVSTRWCGQGEYRGTLFNETQRCSITLIKVNGKVQILSEHCTPIKSNRNFH